jgi:hypothetical protein
VLEILNGKRDRQNNASRKGAKGAKVRKKRVNAFLLRAWRLGAINFLKVVLLNIPKVGN